MYTDISINAETGILSIGSNAVSGDIVVVASSVSKPDISAEYKVKVLEVKKDTDFSITINSGADSSFILPTSGRLNNTNNSYAWIVDWGDGTISEHSGTGTTTSGITHTYPQANTLYNIKVRPINHSELGWLRAFGFTTATTGSNILANKQKITVVNAQLTEQMVRMSINDSYVCAYMFYNCNYLTMGENFQLPQDIIDVGNYFCAYMFYQCTRLIMNIKFQLPQSIINIGTYFCAYMFYNCSSLNMNDTFQLPQGITIIGDYYYFCNFMFYGCITLTMNSLFQLPQNITIAGESFCTSMFQNCTNLKMNNVFQLPQGLVRADAYFCSAMFQNCANLTMNNVFQLPQGITNAGSYFCSYMFQNCKNLIVNSVFKLPQGIIAGATYFCSDMFRNCTNIKISVINFFGIFALSQNHLDFTGSYSYAFENCSSLTEPLIDIPQLQMIPNTRKYTFQGCPATLIAPLHANWK